MSKKTGSLATVLLCGALLTTTIAGCQPQASPSAAPTAAPTAATQADAQPSPQAEAASAKLSDTLVTITAMRDDPASQPLRQDSLVLKYLESELNVRLEIEAVPKANYEDKKKLRITTNNLPDISLVGQKDLVSYASNGVFYNISENADRFPNFHALIEGDYSDLKKLKIDGSFYGTPILCRWQTRGGAVLLMRVDLLEKNNIAIPTTFDEFHDALKQLKEIYPDVIPFTNRKGGSVSGTEKILESVSYPLGSTFSSKLYPSWDHDQSKYTVGPANPEFKEVLSYLNKLYADGLLDPDYATNTSDQWKEKMSSGRALSYFDNAGFGQDFTIALSEIDPDAVVMPIPSLTNSLGQTRNTFYDKNWPSSSYAISAKSKNLDVAAKLLDWYYSEKGCDTAGFGVEGATFEYVDGKPQLLNSIMDEFLNENSPSYAIQSALGIGYASFTPYVDAGAEFQMKMYTNQEGSMPGLTRYIDAYNNIENDPNMRELVLDPPFTAEEVQRINELVSVLQNLFMPEYDKYITGITPMSEYNALIERARAAGAEELENIYNTANARLSQ